MKIAVVHGQAHKGRAYPVTQLLLEKLGCAGDDVSEFYVNGIGGCVGCFRCITQGEDACPHRSQTEQIIAA